MAGIIRHGPTAISTSKLGRNANALEIVSAMADRVCGGRACQRSWRAGDPDRGAVDDLDEQGRPIGECAL
ncbi:MAG TPA: hypothetical protein VIX73_08770, partial [Kofleriaceae bacterium]